MVDEDAIQCGECLVDVIFTGADKDAKVCCPSCGRQDALHEALKEVANYQLHEAIGGRFDGLKHTGGVRVHPDAGRQFRFVRLSF